LLRKQEGVSGRDLCLVELHDGLLREGMLAHGQEQVERHSDMMRTGQQYRLYFLH